MTGPTPLPVRGTWLLASKLLGRPCRVDDPYPHICGSVTADGKRRGRRDCRACAEQAKAAT